MKKKIVKRLISIWLCLVMLFGMSSTVVSANTSSTEPSDWAKEEVELAIQNGLVPKYLQKNYTQPITRAEFCALATSMYETVKNKEIIARLEFTDTDDVNVQKMGALGIVNGTGNGKFSPDKQLERQEAATILCRLADKLHIVLEEGTLNFSDKAKIASWAEKPVARISASKVMSGTGNNRFSPLDSYTREQAILTIIRLYQRPLKESKEPGLENFIKVNSYDARFHDVPMGAWFAPGVIASFEYGLVNGSTDTLYKPDGNLTVAETIVMACRVHNIYYDNNADFSAINDMWYSGYVMYAIENGIVTEEYDYEKPAARAQVAKIMANALPKIALPTCNQIEDDAIPDVKMGDYASEEIYLLYRAGIACGNDKGYYQPNNSISRAEMATILSRLANKKLRIGYNEKQDDFDAATVDDYPEELVINFDEQKNTNFGVLAEDVIQLKNDNNTNIAVLKEDGSYLIEGADAAVRNLKSGDIVKTIDENGEIVLFKVEDVESEPEASDGESGTVKIIPAQGTMLYEYYQFLKVDSELFLDQEEVATLSSDIETYAAETDFNMGIIDGTTAVWFNASLKEDNYDLTVSGAANLMTTYHIQYDQVRFGRDYFYMDFNVITGLKVNLNGNAKSEGDAEVLSKTFDLGKIPVKTPVPGLKASVALSLPLSFEAEGNITGYVSSNRSDYYQYCSDTGWFTDHTEIKDSDLDIYGKFTGSAGLKLTLKTSFLDELMKLTVNGSVKAQLTAEAMSKDEEAANGTNQMVHACDLCVDGNLHALFNVDYGLTLCVSEKTKFDLVEHKLPELKVHLADFYVSLINDKDSVHGGNVAAGFLEICPNYQYLVKFDLVSEKTGKACEDVEDIVIRSKDTGKTTEIRSDQYVYLYEGGYAVYAKNYPELETSFTIIDDAKIVKVKVPEPDERTIYNEYLTGDGFKKLEYIKDMKKKYMQVNTIMADFGGDETKELLLEVVNTLNMGVRGYETAYYLLTIDDDGDVISLANCYYGGGSMGGDSMMVKLDKANGKHVVGINSLFRDGAHAFTTGNFIYHVNDDRASFQCAYKRNSFAVGTWYDNTISQIKQKTNHHAIEDGRFVCWQDLNDKYISKADYDAYNNRFVDTTDNAYKWVRGTTSLPIPA